YEGHHPPKDCGNIYLIQRPNHLSAGLHLGATGLYLSTWSHTSGMRRQRRENGTTAEISTAMNGEF
ncbi:MAG: hypothetical protein ACK5TA_07175, partial [bacterium]